MSIPEINQIFCGDALQVLAQLPKDSVDLIFTSPPYANQRKRCYAGAAPARLALDGGIYLA